MVVVSAIVDRGTPWIKILRGNDIRSPSSNGQVRGLIIILTILV